MSYTFYNNFRLRYGTIITFFYNEQILYRILYILQFSLTIWYNYYIFL